MDSKTKMVSNWGNYPKAKAELVAPMDAQAMRRVVLDREQLIARGNGKCYGDAALAPFILSTKQLHKLLDFDAATGIVHCEAGMLLADLLQQVAPAGWFFHVTPGIKNITVGGAIASDVHGKNHPAKGCFSNWLLAFELLRGDGEIVTCSRTENARLFWQTCGGMGWTGIVLSAKFQLMPISSFQMQQMTVKAKNLDAIFQAFNDLEAWPYAAAWVDCQPEGAALGRGVVYFAKHIDEKKDAPLPRYYPFAKSRNIPFFAPPWLLNRYSIRLHNWLRFGRAKNSEQVVPIDQYFYPLDRISNWNRLYGRRGFIQYQFCLPMQSGFSGIKKIIETIQASPDTPFLSVLKRHGTPTPEAVHSFPIEGYSLALDFPRTRSIFSLVKKLDELVWGYGGKIYLAKDACSAARMGRIDPATFGEAKFHSLLKARLLGA